MSAGRAVGVVERVARLRLLREREGRLRLGVGREPVEQNGGVAGSGRAGALARGAFVRLAPRVAPDARRHVPGELPASRGIVELAVEVAVDLLRHLHRGRAEVGRELLQRLREQVEADVREVRLAVPEPAGAERVVPRDRLDTRLRILREALADRDHEDVRTGSPHDVRVVDRVGDPLGLLVGVVDNPGPLGRTCRTRSPHRRARDSCSSSSDRRPSRRRRGRRASCPA